MRSKEITFVFVAFCGILLHVIHCNIPPTPSLSPAIVDNEEVEVTNFGEDDDVMTRLNGVESIDEFLALMRQNGHPVTINESSMATYVDNSGKLVISGAGGRLAVSDNCSPRNTTIRVSVEGTDSETAFFPRCTRIERCGGCCTSPNLECVPRYTERVVLKVLKGRRPWPGATHLEYNGFAPVIVEKHVSCRIRCKLNSALCGDRKTFFPRKCTCQCTNVTLCSAPYIWDNEDCECKCPQVTQCCVNGDECGMIFDHHNCECVLDRNTQRISININHNRNNNNNNRQAQAEPSTSTTTTTTTSTTTASSTDTTTRSDPCLNYRCPPRFTKVVFGLSCQCQPPNFGSRRRNRNRG